MPTAVSWGLKRRLTMLVGVDGRNAIIWARSLEPITVSLRFLAKPDINLSFSLFFRRLFPPLRSSLLTPHTSSTRSSSQETLRVPVGTSFDRNPRADEGGETIFGETGLSEDWFLNHQD